MFLKRNTKNLCSLFTLLAIIALAWSVLWFGANANTASAEGGIKKSFGGTDTPAAIFPGTGVGAIPDGNTGTPPQFGTPLTINFEVSGVPIVNFIALDITMAHAYVGDLEIVLRSPGGTAQHSIVNRIGATTGGFGDSSDFGGTYSFNDQATGNIWTTATSATCGDTCVITPGNYRTTAAGSGAPTNFLAAFAGLTQAQTNGTWTLTIRDAASSETGVVTAANLYLLTGDPTPPPTATPTPSSEIDLTISQSDAPDPAMVGRSVAYTLTVRSIATVFGGNVSPQVRFNFPSGVPFTLVGAGVTNNYTATFDATGVTFSGGTLSNSGNTGTATLQVIITPQATGTLTSAGGNVVVDPNNTISESNENNNTAQTTTTTVIPNTTTPTPTPTPIPEIDWSILSAPRRPPPPRPGV